ncbi:MAG: prephenate dehydratase domain-containing protein, partial [Dehalococcoidia bacterium]
IVHNLMGKRGTKMGDIEIVYSHPQALGQCRSFLLRELPSVEIAASLSTAAAVEQAVNANKPAAAIAPRRAAEIYRAEILAEDIQDHSNNVTRFVVLAKQDAPTTGDDKTSICFTFDEDKPGQLYRVMGLFAEAGINLTKIESRPTRLGLGRYYFLVDLQGHRNDPDVCGVLEQVERVASSSKVFGSYPRFVMQNGN